MAPNPSEFPTCIETERLLLRGYKPEDAELYLQVSLRNKPHLQQFESGNAIHSIQAEEDAGVVLRQFMDCWAGRRAYFLGAFLKDTREFAAQIYVGVVSWDLPEFEIGYFADSDHEGKGYVTEAVKGVLKVLFETLGAHRVRLECDETNLRSLRVAERCGFVREGLIRETKRSADGLFTGDVHYGLLRSEYYSLA
jgi:RimJ/RimL family protein N-acetyltransferase